MRSDSSRDPFSAAQQLSAGYQQQFRETLHQQFLNESDIDFILNSSALDSGVLLARNPRYQRLNHSFAQEIQRRGWDERIAAELALRRPYQHQVDGFDAIGAGLHTVIATGTGSGKSETFLLPLLNACVHSQGGVVALLVYPMKSLANDQFKRIGDYTREIQDFTKGRIDGDDRSERGQLIARPPALLVTNYVMLDRLLTNPENWPLLSQSRDTLRYVVLDELHSYNGTKAAHLRHLLARLESWLSQKPQYIGASATMGRGESAERDMRQFVTALWQTEPEKCAIIRPTEILAEVEAIWTPDDWTASTPPPGTFGAKITTKEACGALTMMAGTPCSRQDLADPATFEQTPIYLRMRANALVAHLRHHLDEGAVALPEVIDWARETVLRPDDDAESIVTSWLEAIVFLNDKAGKSSSPLLDFRTHIFFRELGPYLRRCLRCRRYAATRRDACPHCGGLTGYVSVVQPKAHLVAMEGADCHLDPLLGGYPSGVYLALLHHADEYNGGEDEPGVTRVSWSPDQPVMADPEGAFVLTPFAEKPGPKAGSLIIGVVPRKHSYESLRALFTSTLKTGYAPCLAFLDSRKRASYLDELIRDAFLGDYVRTRFQQALVDTATIGVVPAYEDARTWFTSQPFSPREQAVLAEFDHWYMRELGQTVKAGQPTPLVLALPDDNPVTEIEREILNIFLQERAIDRAMSIPGYRGTDEARYFRRERGWAEQQRTIHTLAAGEDEDDEDDEAGSWVSISLGENARKYRSLVDACGAQAIADACAELEGRGVLRKVIHGGKMSFVLDPEFLAWVPPAGRPADPPLYMIDVHTSERTPEDRRELEADLKAGAVDIVFATSTLELGIDVGNLNAVFLIGVPPSPANYVQRAGRAGRGEEGRKRNALIVTYCLDNVDRPYEEYYLERPAEMVDGHITSPHFRSDGQVVLEKHLAAELIPALKRGRAAYPNLTLANSIQFVPELERRFGVGFDYAGYCRETLPRQMAELADAGNGWPNAAYIHGIFPDYGFNRDLVYLAPEDKLTELIAEPEKRGDLALTERAFELALIDFVPRRVLSVGGMSYTVMPTEAYETLDDGARQYAVLGAREERFGREVEPKMEIERRLPQVQSACAANQLLTHQLISGTQVSLRCKVHLPEARETDGEREDAFTTELAPPVSEPFIGYDFTRSGLLLAFAGIVDDATIRSVLGVLRRQIAHHLRVRETEISLLPEVQLAQLDPLRNVVFLYDADGNDSIPFEQAQADFAAILRASLEVVTQCTCDTNGCPNCVVSFDSFQQGRIDRALARDFLEHLVHGTAYRPHLRPRQSEADEGIACMITVRRAGHKWRVARGAEELSFDVGPDEAPSLFAAVNDAVRALVPPKAETLIVQTDIGYLAQAILKHQSKKGGLDYASLKTRLLRFRHVACERITGR